MKKIDNIKINKDFTDDELIKYICKKFSINIDNILETYNENEIERKDISDSIQSQCELIIDCENENDLENLYNEMTQRGYQCKISTL